MVVSGFCFKFAPNYDNIKIVNMKKLVFTLLSLCATTAFAQSDAFVVGDFYLTAGQTKEMTISLSNETAYTAFQFDLKLPEGVAIAKENGEYLVSLDNERKADHVLAVGDVGSNTYRFLCYSMTNANIKGNSGSLITVSLTADKETESGKKNVDLQAALLVTSAAASIKPQNSSSNLSVIVLGDANGDGDANVADLAAIINCILDKAPEGYDKSLADINGDGDVNVADIAAEVNVLLYGTVTPPAQARQASKELDPQ